MSEEDDFIAVGRKGKSKGVSVPPSRRFHINDLFDAISENIDMYDRRRLIHGDLIEIIASREFPDKLRLRVLFDVFTSYMASLLSVVQFVDTIREGTPLPTTPVHFAFEDKMWSGTIQQGMAPYAGKSVFFTNLKLPNDGYIYTSKYTCGDSDNEGSNNDDIANDEETNEVVYSFVDALKSSFAWLDVDENICMEVNYRAAEGRFELYLWELPLKVRCVTVKFEYGTYDSFINKKRFGPRNLKTLAAEK